MVSSRLLATAAVVGAGVVALVLLRKRRVTTQPVAAAKLPCDERRFKRVILLQEKAGATASLQRLRHFARVINSQNDIHGWNDWTNVFFGKCDNHESEVTPPALEHGQCTHTPFLVRSGRRTSLAASRMPCISSSTAARTESPPIPPQLESPWPRDLS